MKRVFSGIQPTGMPHLGNYLGAIKQWVDLQNEADEAIFCVVDLHAITVPQQPKVLKENIYSMAALYIACGIDINKSSIFVQSTRPEHSELMWVLNTIASMGELSRMTQFKDKSSKGNIENAGVGLFDYPILMAADILLYNATHVPVGEDQKQHIELTRNLAERFNARFGETFVVPEPVIKKTSARIMGLDNPTKKMSKSADSSLNYILMTDSADVIKNKIKRAVTDSGNEIKAAEDKPALTNLLNIYAEVSGKQIAQIEADFAGRGYGDFKQSLADMIISYLEPIQQSYMKLIADKENLRKILEEGSEQVSSMAAATLSDVQNKVGLGIS